MMRKKKLPRKKSEYVSIKRKQEEEFLQTYKTLKMLTDITKNIYHIGQFLNYMGQALVVIQSKFFIDNQENVKKFARLLDFLQEGKIKKINPRDYLYDPKIIQNLKSFFQGINATPLKEDFIYSIVRKGTADKYSESINFINKLQVPQEELCKYINKKHFLNYEASQGDSKAAKIRSIKKFLLSLTESNESVRAYIQNSLAEYLEKGNEEAQSIILLFHDWKNRFVIGEKVQDSNKEAFFVLNNPRNTGKSVSQGVKI